MINIDVCGMVQLLRSLIQQEIVSTGEARKILSRILSQTGADIIISL